MNAQKVRQYLHIQFSYVADLSIQGQFNVMIEVRYNYITNRPQIMSRSENTILAENPRSCNYSISAGA